ncbi:MAG: cytochrome c [Myxococcales bacterium]|nr:cytochrome c [Myxococcales bacterium]
MAFSGCDRDDEREMEAKGALASVATANDAPQLQILVNHQGHGAYSVETLDRMTATEVVTLRDANLGKTKRYRATPLRALLQGLETHEGLPSKMAILRAKDGYELRVAAERLLEDGAFIAIGEAESGTFEPIGQQHLDPGPFYLVWAGAHQGDVKAYPWPWQLAAIHFTDEQAYPKTHPPKGSSTTVYRGHTLFLKECVRCHAINRDGGSLGPELNLPQNITEYREENQLRSFIQNPKAFRYSAMPAFGHLSPADLDALFAYLRSMATHKRPPR